MSKYQSLMQAVSDARECYLRALQSLLRDLQAEHQQVFSEIAFEPDGEDIAKAFRLMRLDAGIVQDGKVSFVLANVEGPMPFAPIEEHWNGVEVELHPFVWNEARFVVDASPDEAALVAWREHWMDEQEKRFDKSRQLQSVVHSVTRPTRTSAGWSIEVDFGSAEVEAFFALIDLMRQGKARRVVVGSAIRDAQLAT